MFSLFLFSARSTLAQSQLSHYYISASDSWHGIYHSMPTPSARFREFDTPWCIVSQIFRVFIVTRPWDVCGSRPQASHHESLYQEGPRIWIAAGWNRDTKYRARFTWRDVEHFRCVSIHISRITKKDLHTHSHTPLACRDTSYVWCCACLQMWVQCDSPSTTRRHSPTRTRGGHIRSHGKQ